MSARRGIADDRAVAERARPPLHAALEPADHLALGDRGRGPLQSSRSSVDALDRAAGLSEFGERLRSSSRLDLVCAELRPPIGVVHDERPACHPVLCQTAKAAPMAPPASPAAACT